jgi:hypothetical protein
MRGGKVFLRGLKLQIEHQINLSDRKGQARGTLLLKGRDLKIVGSQIRLPGGDQLTTTVNFTTVPRQDVLFDISLEGSLATLHSAQIASDTIAKPATSISPNWQDLLFVKQKGHRRRKGARYCFLFNHRQFAHGAAVVYLTQAGRRCRKNLGVPNEFGQNGGRCLPYGKQARGP